MTKVCDTCERVCWERFLCYTCDEPSADAVSRLGGEAYLLRMCYRCFTDHQEKNARRGTQKQKLYWMQEGQPRRRTVVW